VSFYDDASLVLIPSGIKTSKIYSQKPTDGTGDLTFTRASIATRTNASGVIESVASNVPRLDYSGGATCPRLLLEGQRTNLVFPSATATTQTRTVTATAHTLSFYGTGSVTLSGVATGTLTGTGANNRVALTFTPTAGSLTLTVSGTVTNWQLEAGAFSSTLIPTTTAAVTRLPDVYQRNDIYTNGLISAAGGTWVTELKNNVPYLRDNANQIFIGDGTNFFTSNNFLCIGALLGTSRLIIFTKIAGVFILRHATTTDSVKIAFKWDGITLDIFVNGVKTNSAIAFSVVALNNFMSQGPSNNLFIQQMLLFPTPLTDAQCIELTTL